MISVKSAGGKGTITGNVGGIVGGINCGNVCSASVAPGTMVMLTAAPAAGFSFVNWTGVCSGAALTCSFNVTGGGTAQANFTK